jgi:hypothetical protein
MNLQITFCPCNQKQGELKAGAEIESYFQRVGVP